MRTLAAALLLLGAFPLHAQMVKCVDELGVVHYTDKPRPGCKGGEVNIQGQPPISGMLQRLDSQRRVVTVDPQGERTFLDDGVRQQRIEQLRSEIARGCS